MPRTWRRQESPSPQWKCSSRNTSRTNQTHSGCERRRGLSACHRQAHKAHHYRHILKKFLKIVPLSPFPCCVRLIEEGHESLKINKFRSLFISPLDLEIHVLIFQTYLPPKLWGLCKLSEGWAWCHHTAECRALNLKRLQHPYSNILFQKIIKSQKCSFYIDFHFIMGGFF